MSEQLRPPMFVPIMAGHEDGRQQQVPFASIHAARVTLHHITDLVFVEVAGGHRPWFVSTSNRQYDSVR